MRKETFSKIVKFILNPHLLICFGIAWIITNGWAYAMFGIGTYFKVDWMIAVSTAYMAFLWIPVTPEKLVTILIAMVLLKLIFPKDEKTLGTLKELHSKIKLRPKKKKSCENEGKCDDNEVDSSGPPT